MHIFIMHTRNRHISTSGLKSDITIVSSTRFLIRCENFGNSQTFEADISLFMFAWIFRTCWACWPKIGEGVVQ